YEEEASIARGGEKLDQKMDVKLDMELDMKTSHGRARRSGRNAREEEMQLRPAPARSTGRTAGRPVPAPGSIERLDNVIQVITHFIIDFIRYVHPVIIITTVLTEKIGQPLIILKDKDAADLMTWRDYEALRNEMRREFCTRDDELRGSVQEISQKLDATNETVTTMTDHMTDIQRSLQALQLVVDNLTQQQQEEDEDPELQDEARGVGRGVGRGNRGRGFVELGACRVPPQQHDDGLGKPKFSIPKFEGGADVEEYLTWELKIEKL
ncbi:hypothetical protein QYE76_042518, partial [Lolium multiflorum]